MRGRVKCLYCRQVIVHRDDAWKNLKDGGIICPAAPGPDHKHKIGVAA